MRLFLTFIFAAVAMQSNAQEAYTMTVESNPAAVEGMTTYRFYVNMLDESDRLSAIYGNNEQGMALDAPSGVYNNAFNTTWNASGVNPLMLEMFPELVADTYATIGLAGPASASTLPNAEDPSLVEDNTQPITPFFQNDGETQIESNTVVGSSWFVLNEADNALPSADLRVLFLQVTTAGDLSGTLNAQVFPLGVSANRELLTFDFDGAGLYGQDGPLVDGCNDETACNFDEAATVNDGSCVYDDALGVCGGDCDADADGDGVCDDEDDCVGAYDACGVCNGPGAVLECGCAPIENGECDCDGNVLDAIGVCGGGCAADEDGDGVCDDEDDCIGAFDACGVCNGPGEIYECGCTDIAAGACDCDGNELDVLGVCGGGCEADANGNGICDDAEVLGCTDGTACNYDSSANVEDGSCEYCSCFEDPSEVYTVVVESTPSVFQDATVYRFYIQTINAEDQLSAIFSYDPFEFRVDAPSGVFNSELNNTWNASGLSPALLAIYPEMADDTYATLGLEGPASASGLEGASDPTLVEDSDQRISPFFLNDGATSLLSNSVSGASWFVTGDAANATAGADKRVLFMQVSTAGPISGTVNAQIFELGVPSSDIRVTIDFDGEGVFSESGPVQACGCTDATAFNYDPEAEYDNGSCVAVVEGCTDATACNYDAAANTDNGGCLYDDALGVCGGGCAADADGDGVCDDVDDCVGQIDACGICNGPGDIYECGCDPLPDGDCDCDGNQLDECGVCGGAGAVFECGCADIPAGDCDCNGNQLDALGVCGGDCAADADGDGVCDDEDDCVGVVDECGVCNGPGAVLECGCAPIENGECDCDGNVLDAVGVCGGGCAADADGDGVCDDEDDCIGAFDACGVCNGPGEIYECGCTDIAAGACDCDGNELDVLGVCGGGCEADANGNGICDDAEVLGCTDGTACNYDSSANVEDGSCEYCSCFEDPSEVYTVVVESTPSVFQDATVYRFYIQTINAEDQLSAIFSYDPFEFRVDAPSGVFNSELNNTWNASGLSPALLAIYPEMADDTYATLGLEGPASASGLEGASDPTLVEDADQRISPFFLNDGATSLLSNSVSGASWFVTGDAANATAGADKRVLFMQVSTAGPISGTVNAQIFELGVPSSDIRVTIDFDGEGVFSESGPVQACGCTDATAFNYDPEAEYDNGSCVAVVEGCTDATACNYDAAANTDNGGCLYDDALGVCGGGCAADADGDGVCDDVDDCVGQIDACGICNGPGDIYECGCDPLPDGDCDCDGNQLDECGVCGGAGAVFECGCADIPAGDCDCNGNQLDALGVCGGDCAADADGDGVCDDEDDCVGVVDECGVCNGPGATYDCGCDPIPEGDCDCEGNQLDEVGVCGGECTLDLDMDGICDDVDTCLGNLDECGICNGPGAVYQCGCDFLPLGDCDCEGNQVDALGVCGGGCEADANCNGVCDDEEVLGCMDMMACNFHPTATQDDGSCTYCTCDDDALSGYTLTVEAHPAVTEGLTSYRLYVDMVNDNDRLSAVFGNTMNNLVVDAPMGAYNHSVNGSWNASGLNPFFIFFYPELVDDTYGTIGLTEPEHTSDIPDAMDPVLAEDPSQPISPFFQTNGATGLAATSFIGSAWYVLNTAGNGLPDHEGRVIVMQVTTSGDIMGQINTQIFPMSVGDNNEIVSFLFEGTGTFGPIGSSGNAACGCTDASAANFDPAAEYDDGSCEDMVWGCIDEEACNYDDAANTDNGTCQYVDECGECGGQGIPMGACDCEGNLLDALGVCGGDCATDMDGDGVCDNADDCIGELDACGICNGPGAVFDCGCDVAPAGACDCNGNMLDALGVCGGDCATDMDGDGVCDDQDECVGVVDECGVCNGPGAMFECGCTTIPAGACDCEGNQLDAVGVCGGDCMEDANGNGICDVNELEGCTEPEACNYNAAATENDGSCDFCSCEESVYGMTVMAYPAVTPGHTTYRMYVDMVNADDRMSAVYGNNEYFMNVNAPMGALNNGLNGSWNASGINASLLMVFPDLVDDSYATIGLSGPASESELPSAADPSLVEDPNQAITPFFLSDGATSMASTTSVGASWFVLSNNGNGLADENMQVMIMQVTTPGTVHGVLNFQILTHGVGEDIRVTVEFDGVGMFYDVNSEAPQCGCTNDMAMNYNPQALYDDGSCEAMVWGCMNPMACNYDENSNADNGSCLYTDACGVCGGQGIPMGACDCDGNMLDALGVCGGGCESDMDGDGVCDSEDECMGEFDECGVCNGPGAMFECGCTMVPEGDCDCDGNQLDAVGVCGGDCESDLDANGMCDADEGCMYDMAMNFDPEATMDNGSCEFNNVSDCPADIDGSGHINVNDLLVFLPQYGNFCE